MATRGSENASDEIITVKCCVCAKKNITKEAEKYCVQCQDYYCVPCTDMHKMFPAMVGHQILDKADFRSHGLQSHKSSDLPCLPTERCSVHKTKLLDLYCGNHDEVVCGTCVALNHKTCQDLHSIPEDIEMLYQQSIFGDTISKLNAAKKTLEDINKTKDCLLKKLKEQKNEIINSIGQLRTEIETVIVELEKESISMVESQFESIAAALQKEISEASECVTDFGQFVDKLQKCVGNKAQEFVCVKKAEKNIRKASEVEIRLNRTGEVELVFQADTKIQNFLQQLKTFGDVSTHVIQNKPRSSVYVVKARKEINIKLKDDTEGYSIYGSCFTTEGDLLLTDYHNQRLKRVKMSTGLVKDHLDLDYNPIAACQISKGEVAVSIENSTIQFVSVGDKMKTTCQLKLDHRCYGLSFKDEKLFVSDGRGTVYIHDRTGRMLGNISTNQSGKPVFICSRHIVHSSNGNKVFVADNNNGLVILDKMGNYETTFTDPDLVLAQGVCSDGSGNIFVSGICSKIVQISEISNTKTGELNNRPCHSVCFDPQQNILAVTQSGDVVHIYELE